MEIYSLLDSSVQIHAGPLRYIKNTMQDLDTKKR